MGNEQIRAEYSQGVCGDGAAILKDGQPMTIDEIVAELNQAAHAGYAKSHEALEQELSVMHATVASYSSATEALKALIDWHVQVALDPKVNGGKVLIDEGELSGLHAACASLSETIYCLQEK